MIVTRVSDRFLEAAIRRVARPDEDVISDTRDRADALRHGFPRLAVQDAEHPRLEGPDGPLPSVYVRAAQMRRWRESWQASGTPPSWVEFAAAELGPAVGEGRCVAWIDAALRDLSRAVGRPLPPALVGLARRVLEYPSGYVDMGDLGALTGLSVGALKARFRRRGLPSPFSYLRWLRCIAVASRLQQGANVADAARRLGWTSTGNLCRYVYTTTGHAPSALGVDGAWEMILASFATKHLDPVALDAWEGLDDLFLRTSVA